MLKSGPSYPRRTGLLLTKESIYASPSEQRRELAQIQQGDQADKIHQPGAASDARRLPPVIAVAFVAGGTLGIAIMAILQAYKEARHD